MANEPGGITASVRRQIAEGRSPEDIVETLVAGGLSKPSAQRFVDRALAEAPADAGPADWAPPAETWAPASEGGSLGTWIKVILAAGGVAILYAGYVVVTTSVAERQFAREQMEHMVTDVRTPPVDIDTALETVRTGRDMDRCNAAMALGRQRAFDAAKELIAVLQSPPQPAPSVQICIVAALVLLGERPVAVGYYTTWINGDHPDLWRAAVGGFGDLGPEAGPAAIAGLKRALLSEHYDLRLLAVMSAEKIGGDAVEVLEAAADDEHPTVSAEANKALARLSK